MVLRGLGAIASLMVSAVKLVLLVSIASGQGQNIVQTGRRRNSAANVTLGNRN